MNQLVSTNCLPTHFRRCPCRPSLFVLCSVFHNFIWTSQQQLFWTGLYAVPTNSRSVPDYTCSLSWLMWRSEGVPSNETLLRATFSYLRWRGVCLPVWFNSCCNHNYGQSPKRVVQVYIQYLSVAVSHSHFHLCEVSSHCVIFEANMSIVVLLATW